MRMPTWIIAGVALGAAGLIAEASCTHNEWATSPAFAHEMAGEPVASVPIEVLRVHLLEAVRYYAMARKVYLEKGGDADEIEATDAIADRAYHLAPAAFQRSADFELWTWQLWSATARLVNVVAAGPANRGPVLQTA